LFQIVDQIVGALDADRQADKPVINAKAAADIFRDRGMCHQHGVLDQAFYAANDSASVNIFTSDRNFLTLSKGASSTMLITAPKPCI
jgi:hypothetical protein